MEKNKQDKSLKIFFLVLFLLLLLLVLVVFLKSFRQYTDQSFEYNGIQFSKDRFGYQMTLYINQATYPALLKIRNSPRTLEDIPISDVSFLVDKEQIYVVIDPWENLTGKTTIAALEIDSFIDNEFLYHIPVNSAFTKEYKSYKDELIKTCDDVNDTEGIIMLGIGEETSIFDKDGCVFVQGKSEDDIIRAADRLVLTLLGIMSYSN